MYYNTMQSLLLDLKLNKLSPAEYLKVQNEFSHSRIGHESSKTCHAHAVNIMDLEKFDDRYLLSGGADSCLKVWDTHDFSAVGSISRNSGGHKYAVSHLQWYPNDTGLFVSSSFDNTCKVWDTNTLTEAYSFDLGLKVFNVDISPQGIVAVGLDSPYVRLLDLRSTSNLQNLMGHKARKILSVKWHPRNEHILSSGSIEGEVFMWDIRRSDTCVTRLDCMDTDRAPFKRSYSLDHVKAHGGAVNSLLFNELGTELISLGNDEKIRVWDLASKGAQNKLVNYGPLIRNRFPQHLKLCLTPRCETELQYLWVPSDNGEILVFRYQDGRLVSRLGSKSRTTGIVYGGGQKFYAGKTSGEIETWAPQIQQSEDQMVGEGMLHQIATEQGVV